MMHLKGQAAPEYLSMYAVALLIVMVVLTAFYIFFLGPESTTPNICNFLDGYYCEDLVVGTLSQNTVFGVLLTNAQQFPVMNPSIQINTSGALINGTCEPHYVMPGGSIFCNATTPGTRFYNGELIYGQVLLSALYCYNAGTSGCRDTSSRTYVANFDAHPGPLSPNAIHIALNASSYSVPSNGMGDTLTANVLLYGYPVPQAGVNFTLTTNAVYANLSKVFSETDESGNATTSINSIQTTGNQIAIGTVASFGSFNSLPVYVTFVSGKVTITFDIRLKFNGATEPVLTIDGVTYDSKHIPESLQFTSFTTHTFAWNWTVPSNPNYRYIYNITGSAHNSCGYGNNGTLSANANCTDNVTYTLQLPLKMNVSPSGAGVVSPGNGWYNTSSSVQLDETANAGYCFSSWSGDGNGHYTGANTMPTITFIDTHINQTANFVGC